MVTKAIRQNISHKMLVINSVNLIKTLRNWFPFLLQVFYLLLCFFCPCIFCQYMLHLWHGATTVLHGILFVAKLDILQTSKNPKNWQGYVWGHTHTHTKKIPIQPYQTWHENEYIFMANSWIVCSKADKMSTKVDRHQQVVISKKEPMIWLRSSWIFRFGNAVTFQKKAHPINTTNWSHNKHSQVLMLIPNLMVT